MLKRSLYLCFVVMLFWVSSAPVAAEPMSLDKLADICEAAELAVYDAVVEYETYNEPAPQLKDIAGTGLGIAKGRTKDTWEWAMPQASVQWCKSTTTVTIMNEDGNACETIITQSYDGEIAKQYQITVWPNSRSISGTVANQRNFMPLKCTTPLAFTVLRDDEPVLSERLRSKVNCFVFDSNELVNGFKTIGVDISSYIKDKKIPSERVYFAVDFDFLPARMEYFNGRDVVLTVDVLEFEKTEEGLWFPKKAKLVPSEGSVYVYEAQKIVLNQGLKKEYFDIDFPAGTKVYDETRGIRYVVPASQ